MQRWTSDGRMALQTEVATESSHGQFLSFICSSLVLILSAEATPPLDTTRIQRTVA